jgi:hypothetical protein
MASFATYKRAWASLSLLRTLSIIKSSFDIHWLPPVSSSMKPVSNDQRKRVTDQCDAW